MNTIKIFLAESGRVADLRKDFPLYKGQFNDKLLNVLVPTSILAPQFELQHYIGQLVGSSAPSDQTLDDFVEANTYPTRSAEQGDIIEFYNSTSQSFFIYTYNNDDWESTEVDSFGTLNTIAGTSVKIGMTATKPNGTTYKSKSYFMRYLKTLTYQNVEYALYERKLPKEFTSFVGQGQNAPTLVINVVNVDTENNAVTSIITSQTCSLDVMASNMLDQDESIEASDLELLEAEVNTLSAEMDLKQDKTDQTLNTTSKMVVGAINELDLQVDANTTQVATNTGDISSLDTRVTALEQQDATEETYIGKMTGTTLPTDAELDAFVLSTAGRETQGGDVVMFVLEVTGGTDKNYKYKYSSITNSWSGYEIPATEPASNTDMGIVQGSYGSAKNTQVDIVGGNINDIYVKDNANTLRSVREYVNTDNAALTNILNGTTAVGKATRADQDGNGNNIVQTYLTQTAGATKQQLYNYALPRAFNDVSFLDANNVFSDTVPSESSALYTSTSSGVGDTTLFSAVKTFGDVEFQLASKNSYTATYYAVANNNCNVQFRLTTEIDVNGSWVTANIELTDDISMTNGSIKKLAFTSSLNYLTSVEEFASGDKIRQTLEVITQFSTPVTFSIYSNETYPSTFYLNTTAQNIILSQGELGELPTFEIQVSALDAGNQSVTFEIPSTFVITEDVQALFILNYTGASSIWDTTKILVKQGIQDIPLKVPSNFNAPSSSTDYITNAGLMKTAETYENTGANRTWVFTGVFKTINGTLTLIADVSNTKILELSINSAMSKTNPTGTGYFSINRKANTNRGVKSVAMGDDNSATAAASVAFGQGNSSSGQASVAEGFYSNASGLAAHAEGNYTVASGNYSHAEGSYSQATKEGSHAEGRTYATGQYSHAEGRSATASGDYSHAGGYGSTSTAFASFATGSYCNATAEAAMALGENANSSGLGSVALGFNVTANHKAQMVFGEWNVADTNSAAATSRGDYVEIVGNGENATRSNARTLDWSGNEYLAGNLQAAGLTDGTTTKTMTQILAGGGGSKYQHNIQFRFSVTPSWQDNSSQVVDTTALITFIDDDSTKITTSNISSRVFTPMNLSSSNPYYLNTRDRLIYDGSGENITSIIYCASAFAMISSSFIVIQPYKLWKYDTSNGTYSRGHSGLLSSLYFTIVDVQDLVVEI